MDLNHNVRSGVVHLAEERAEEIDRDARAASAQRCYSSAWTGEERVGDDAAMRAARVYRERGGKSSAPSDPTFQAYFEGS